MRIVKRLAGLAAAVAAVGLLLATVTGASAPPAVPISFDQFHTTTAVFKYLKDVAAAYPAITELREIGTSTMGRPIYVLVVSNMKTGTTLDALVPLRNPRAEGVKNVTPMKPYMGKPGHWIGGSTHGNEYTGTEVALAMIDRLVSGYGTDPAITKLVDTKTFYICPIINPDGHFNSLEKGISQRANSALKDDDGDGKVNEDGPDDLDGDGVIAQFRYKDPKGQFVMDEADPRLMVRLGPNEQTAKPRYSVITEDKDNDGDKKRGEDPEAGIDINRNFPERWWRDDSMPGGTGAYPTSSPEVRAVAEFFHTHPNILMAQFFHTSGGFTYRPLGSAPQTQIAAEGPRGLRLRHGEEVPRNHRRGCARGLDEAGCDPGPARGTAQDVEEQVRHRARLRVPARVEGELRRDGRPLVRVRALHRLGLPPAGHLLAHDRAVEPRDRHPRIPEDCCGRRRRRACPPARPAPVQRRAVRRQGLRGLEAIQAPRTGRGRDRRLEPEVREQRLAGRHPEGRVRPARGVRALPRGADARPGDHRGLGARRLRRAERDAGGGRREGRHGGRDEGRAARRRTGCSR